MDQIITRAINNHQEALILLKKNAPVLQDIAGACLASLRAGGKIIFCGNGGSAADSQHLAAELVGRFKKEKQPLPALALSVNTSVITAIGNDYGFERVFSDQVAALASDKDILIGISTSGDSANVILAVDRAKEKGLATAAFLGKTGGRIKGLVDHALVINCDDTARVQEMHILAGHIICELIEEQICE